MTLLQIILLILAGGIFYLFFRQLFSGNYPKRGVDYEAKVPDAQIGGINRPDKTFSTPHPEDSPDRITQLLDMAEEAMEKGDNLEAKKALQSLLILDENNTDALHRLGVVYLNMNDYTDAKSTYEKLLELNENDDLAHASLANTLHKLGEDEEAVKHHERAIELDPTYAPHYYNYANTLYDMGDKSKALELYEKAYSIDPKLKAAEDMIRELKK